MSATLDRDQAVRESYARDASGLRRVPDAVARPSSAEHVADLLRDVLAMGGTVSAEHSIGKIKARWLPLQLSALQVGILRAIKHELDPRGILAPGNILGSPA